jgi:hypothetical protein
MYITAKEYDEDKLFWWRRLLLLPFQPLCWFLFRHEIGNKSFCLNCGATLHKGKPRN